MMQKIFVYGTLKYRCPNHHVLTDISKGIAEYVCSAKTKLKYPLVVAGDYNIPFLLNQPGVGHHVTVEVYRVDQMMKQFLDKMERVGVLYDTEVLDLITDNSGEISCPGYLLNDWLDFMEDLPMVESYSDLDDSNASYIPPSKRVGPIINLVKQVKKCVDEFSS